VLVFIVFNSIGELLKTSKSILVLEPLQQPGSIAKDAFLKRPFQHGYQL
jgi:hypothetical protein